MCKSRGVSFALVNFDPREIHTNPNDLTSVANIAAEELDKKFEAMDADFKTETAELKTENALLNEQLKAQRIFSSNSNLSVFFAYYLNT